jgi:hypothetical protein
VVIDQNQEPAQRTRQLNQLEIANRAVLLEQARQRNQQTTQRHPQELSVRPRETSHPLGVHVEFPLKKRKNQLAHRL